MKNKKTNATSVIVSVDFSNGKDNSIMLVGKKVPGKDVQIVNAIQGEEAEDLFLRLVGPDIAENYKKEITENGDEK